MTKVRCATWTVSAGLTSLMLASWLAGCGGGSATTPNPSNKPQLAGGGRGASSDDPGGGGENSGPQSPDVAIAPGYIPILYAEYNCFEAPFAQVITDQTALQAWWTTAISCQPRYNMGFTPPPDPNNGGNDSGGGGSTPGDPEDGGIDPEPYDPYPADAPVIDFSEYVVAVIGLEASATYGKGIWVTNAVDSAAGTTISYEVSQPGDDCEFGAPEGEDLAPMIAVLIPTPATAPYTFERTDTTWNCTWEPDPNEPWTVYFTDAECVLGPNEMVITDEATWAQWLDAAYDCDLARWNDPIYGDPGTGIGGGSNGSDPYPGTETEPPRDNPVEDPEIDPVPPPSGMWGVDVDFTTHQIIVLRAGNQTKWGGGLWLNEIETTGSSTNYAYTVMQPTGDCPVADGQTLNPTVAIRVPKPAGAVTFERSIESIDCDWGNDKPLPEPLPPTTSNGAPRE